MANLGKWAAPSLQSMLTTELNSLSNATMTAASTAFDNSSNLYVYADVEVVLAALSPAAGAYVSIYLWCAEDGTNYPAQSDADLRLTTSQLFCTIPIGTTASTAQRAVARNLLLPPALFKVKLDNQSGVSLGATLNTVKFNMYNINLNG